MMYQLTSDMNASRLMTPMTTPEAPLIRDQVSGVPEAAIERYKRSPISVAYAPMGPVRAVTDARVGLYHPRRVPSRTPKRRRPRAWQPKAFDTVRLLA